MQLFPALMIVSFKALRKHLGKNARKEVVVKYTWDKHVERILEGVERVVRRGQK
jgi:glycosyltransferase involved in cell wall biosynthesis